MVRPLPMLVDVLHVVATRQKRGPVSRPGVVVLVVLWAKPPHEPHAAVAAAMGDAEPREGGVAEIVYPYGVGKAAQPLGGRGVVPVQPVVRKRCGRVIYKVDHLPSHQVEGGPSKRVDDDFRHPRHRVRVGVSSARAGEPVLKPLSHLGTRERPGQFGPQPNDTTWPQVVAHTRFPCCGSTTRNRPPTRRPRDGTACRLLCAPHGSEPPLPGSHCVYGCKWSDSQYPTTRNTSAMNSSPPTYERPAEVMGYMVTHPCRPAHGYPSGGLPGLSWSRVAGM